MKRPGLICFLPSPFRSKTVGPTSITRIDSLPAGVVRDALGGVGVLQGRVFRLPPLVSRCAARNAEPTMSRACGFATSVRRRSRSAAPSALPKTLPKPGSARNAHRHSRSPSQFARSLNRMTPGIRPDDDRTRIPSKDHPAAPGRTLRTYSAMTWLLAEFAPRSPMRFRALTTHQIGH